MSQRETWIIFFTLLLIASVNNVVSIERSLRLDNEMSDLVRILGSINFIDPYKDYVSNDDDSNCVRDLSLLKKSLVKRELWALKMVDASSKIPSGILEGNLIDMGMYDECVAVRQDQIRGRHCMYTIETSIANFEMMKPTLSICVPSSCNADEVRTILNDSVNSNEIVQRFGIKVNTVTCSSMDTDLWGDVEFVICFWIIISYTGFLIMCSICDLMIQYRKSGTQNHRIFEVLSKFSLVKSASAILSTKVTKGNLPGIHGVRFLSMAWVVLGHQYIVPFLGVNVNSAYFIEWVKSWKSLYIFIAPFAVDTFFTMSGFLMTYMYIRHAEREKTINLPVYYLHRYIRLTPALIALLVFSIAIIPKMGSGARWDLIMEYNFGKCRNKWWKTLLYLQNFIDKKDMCLGHLWYLAVDMQLFWISPIILYPLYKKPKLGLIILAAMFLASIVTPGLIIGINKYRPYSMTQDPSFNKTIDEFMDVYTVPYNRAGPWIVGIFLGYEVASKIRKLSKFTICLGWVISAASLSFCTFGTRYFMEPTYDYDVILETFFAAVSRPIWAIGISWIIYACINNCAGPISTFLSFKCFIPLSRLSYCIYLVHYVIQMIQIASQRTPSYYSDYYVWNSYLSVIVISIVVGFFLSVLFESPVLVLEKMIFRRKRESLNELTERYVKNEK